MVHVWKPTRLRQEFQPNLGYVAESLYNKKEKEEGKGEGSWESSRDEKNGTQEKIWNIYIYIYECLKPIIKIISTSCIEHSKEVYQLA